MSLRLRLTLLTTAVVLAVSAVLGATFAITASNTQVQTIDDNLQATLALQRIRGLILNPRPVPADVFSTVAIVLVESNGRNIVLRSAGYGSDPLPLPTLTGSQLVSAIDEPITIDGEPTYRALAAADNRRGQVAVALTPLSEIEQQLQGLDRIIVFSIIGVTVIGAVLAWLFIGRGLRPVREMADAAKAIADGELTRRVPDGPSGTELGDLSSALNAMIAELTASVIDLRESEERLRAFVSDASHELRTPLTVIRGYGEILEREGAPSPELSARAIASIRAETERLDALVTRLLALQRADSPTDPSQTVNLAEVFGAVFSIFEDLHPDRRVTVDVQPATVIGGNESWTQVAGNLAQNIDRYTQPGSPVTVQIVSSAHACEVIVDDAGEGIPANLRDSMLDRFTRLDDSRSRQTGGLGLGLSIVRAIVTSAGGRVALAESPMGGLRVRLSVPLAGRQDGVDAVSE